jgi:outer membrane protein
MKIATILALLIGVLGSSAAAAPDSLTLRACIDLALKNNYAVKNSDLELKAAQQYKKSALTNILPTVSATGLQFGSQDPLITMGSGPDRKGSLGRGVLGSIGVTQAIFDGGRTLTGIKLAGLDVESSRTKGAGTRDEVVLKTEEQYWQIISLQEKAKTIRVYGQMLDSLLKQVGDAFMSGVVMENDLLKVRLQKSEVLLDQSRLDNAIELARMSFCQFLGLPLDSDFALRDSLTIESPPQALRVNHAQALTTRSEYRLLELSVRAEKLQSRMVLGEYLPTVSVGANYQTSRFDGGDNQSNGLIYGMVSIPISAWWGGSHEIKKRKQVERIAENNFKDNSERLVLQMEQSWRDLTDAYTQYQLAEEANEQATENMEVNQDSYDSGLTPVSDLLEARALLQRTLDQVTESKAQYLTQRSKYLQVTGRLQH